MITSSKQRITKLKLSNFDRSFGLHKIKRFDSQQNLPKTCLILSMLTLSLNWIRNPERVKIPLATNHLFLFIYYYLINKIFVEWLNLSLRLDIKYNDFRIIDTTHICETLVSNNHQLVRIDCEQITSKMGFTLRLFVVLALCVASSHHQGGIFTFCVFRFKKKRRLLTAVSNCRSY